MQEEPSPYPLPSEWERVLKLPLELPVESCREDIDRTSVSIERRVTKELVVERQITALCEGNIIIRFQRHLGRVAQVAVAVQNASAARLQEGDLIGRSAGYVAEQTEGVVRTVPGGAFDADAELNRPVNVSERRRRRFAVLPAKPGERADVLRNLLLPIHPNAVFGTVAEGGLWDRDFHSCRGIRRGRGADQKSGRRVIVGEQSVVDPCRKQDVSGMVPDAPTSLEFHNHSPLFPKIPVGGDLPRLDGPHQDPVIGGETIWNAGQLEPSITQGPVRLIEVDGKSCGESDRVCWIIPGEQRVCPTHELCVRVSVVDDIVEKLRHVQPADGDRESRDVLFAG